MLLNSADSAYNSIQFGAYSTLVLGQDLTNLYTLLHFKSEATYWSTVCTMNLTARYKGWNTPTVGVTNGGWPVLLPGLYNFSMWNINHNSLCKTLLPCNGHVSCTIDFGAELKINHAIWVGATCGWRWQSRECCQSFCNSEYVGMSCITHKHPQRTHVGRHIVKWLTAVWMLDGISICKITHTNSSKRGTPRGSISPNLSKRSTDMKSLKWLILLRWGELTFKLPLWIQIFGLQVPWPALLAGQSCTMYKP